MNLHLPAAIFLIFGFTVYSQPILTNPNHSYSAGETFLVNKCAYVNPGPPGVNQTWDFSSVSAVESKTWSTGTTSGTPSYSNAVNITLSDSVNNRHYYYSFFNDSSIAHISDEFASSCVQYHLNLTYPFSFNDSISRGINCQTAPASGGLQSYSVKYDGYGTIKLPGGIYTNVARIRYISNMPVYQGFGGPSFQGSIYDTTYMWYVPNVHYPLARAKYNYFNRYNSTPVIISEFSYLNENSVGIRENNALVPSFNIFPNPSNGVLTISVGAQDSGLQFEIIDLLGKTAYPASLIGNNSPAKTIDISYLAEGVYFIRLFQKGGVSTKKLIIAR